MLRKTMLLVAALTLTSLGLPALASASVDSKSFTRNGKVLSSVENVTVDGYIQFTTELGGISCSTKSTVDLGMKVGGVFTAATGTVTFFEVRGGTSKCLYFGGLDAFCEDVIFHAGLGLPWTTHGTGLTNGMGEVVVHGMSVTGIHFEVGGSGAFCPDVTFSGDIFLAGNAHLGNNFVVSGTLQSNLGATAAATGEQAVTAKTKVEEEEVEDIYGLET